MTVAGISLSWERVLAWRQHRQFLHAPGDADVATVVHRLCGVQAQVPSAAELAVALRRRAGRSGDVDAALRDRRVVRTWAMRGTLHVLEPQLGAACLALIAAARTWETGSWQRNFVTTAQLERVADAVHAALDGRILTREELVGEVLERTGDAGLVDHLRSGWGAVLKPLAWQGLLCNGPSDGQRVTFTRPDRYLDAWPGLPAPADAARIALPAYLGAFGPAPIEAFDAWLTRGASKRRALRGWVEALGGELATVEVEGVSALARAADVDEIAATPPSSVVRLLPGFDQYVLGPGTGDARIVPPARRTLVSRAAGWIAPVVVAAGRVAGTWAYDDDRVSVALFRAAEPVAADALEAETQRIGAALGTSLTLAVETVD